MDVSGDRKNLDKKLVQGILLAETDDSSSPLLVLADKKETAHSSFIFLISLRPVDLTARHQRPGAQLRRARSAHLATPGFLLLVVDSFWCSNPALSSPRLSLFLINCTRVRN